jgi:hypothetical protein
MKRYCSKLLQSLEAIAHDRGARTLELQEESSVGWSDLADVEVLVGRASVSIDNWSNSACRNGSPGAAAVLLDDASAALHRVLIALEELSSILLLDSGEIVNRPDSTTHEAS